jgi:hypothetical protein
MTIINTYDIMTTIQDILEADVRTQSMGSGDRNIIKVEVETAWDNIVDYAPSVKIYADSWTSPPEQEYIGPGSNAIRTFIVLEIVCIAMDFQSSEIGASRRDDLFRRVKEVLKDNRTVSGKGLITRFISGEFHNAKKNREDGFWKIATMRFEIEVRE